MATITRIGAGKVENGGRRSYVATVKMFLIQEEDDFGRVIEVINSILRAPHRDGDRIRAYIGRHRGAKNYRSGRGACRKTDGRQFRE